MFYCQLHCLRDIDGRVRKLNAQLRQEGKGKWTNVAPSVASVGFFAEDLAWARPVFFSFLFKAQCRCRIGDLPRPGSEV